jgi:hypothetical protein
MTINLPPKRIEVIAYSGYRANERPLAFRLDHMELEVQEVIDRWYGVEHDWFKVLTNEGNVYLLKWHRTRDLWFLEKVIEKSGSQ